MEPLRHNKRIKNEVTFLGVLTCFCTGLFLFRFLYSKTTVYQFLIWNLFLASIPYIFSAILMTRQKYQQNKLTVIFVLFSWLLFFPNAPYILTDLFHLRDIKSMPVWYDLLMLLFYSWTGIMFGFLSLMHVEIILKRFFNERFITFLIIFLFFLAGFGIYIGRYLRWNSWDIFKNPGTILNDIVVRALSPLQHPAMWGMTFIMGVFLFLVYYSLRFFKTREYQLQKEKVKN